MVGRPNNGINGKCDFEAAFAHSAVLPSAPDTQRLLWAVIYCWAGIPKAFRILPPVPLHLNRFARYFVASLLNHRAADFATMLWFGPETI
jgi:hypothetical protein